MNAIQRLICKVKGHDWTAEVFDPDSLRFCRRCGKEICATKRSFFGAMICRRKGHHDERTVIDIPGKTRDIVMEHCTRCGKMTSMKSIPHGSKDDISYRVKEMMI